MEEWGELPGGAPEGRDALAGPKVLMAAGSGRSTLERRAGLKALLRVGSVVGGGGGRAVENTRAEHPEG